MIYVWISLGVIAFAVILCAFFYFCNNALTVTKHTVNLDTEKPVRIVHLSDLHGKSFGKDNAKLIEKIKKLNPDFIAYTGDIIHLYRPRDKEVALKFASVLSQIAPFIYISGNHEMRNKGYRFLRKELIEAGATVLDDKTVTVCAMSVTGLNGASLKNETIFKITPDADKKILLAHDPRYFERYAKAGYDLVLCGHAHGGQWRIPFTHKGLFAPGQGAFPKYSEGLHGSGKTKMIISRGLGNSEFPLRLFNRPEIVVVDIK